MRESKFRGYSHEHERWIYGDLLQYPDGEVYIVEHSDGESLSYRVEPKTIGQYIWLKDKNGKEIYDGDIVENGGYYNIMGVVRYDTEYAHYFIRNEASGESMDFAEISSSEVEVIGNIHDNPELINEVIK